MGGVEQSCYTLINFPTDAEPYNELQLKIDLERGDIKKKIEALKKVIGIILSGEKIPGILMVIIRFVLPLQDHTIKKLLLIFWEIVPKTTPDGKLLQEMILVCDSYRKDLQHPNEFIRGSTLRFLCKLKEPELLEPLMPAIRACLEHRHSYVRRNAVLAIFTIYRNFDFLIPDAPELIGKFLETEQDMSCKRNAFLMLLHAEQERALSYLADRLDSVAGFGDILQLVIVELIYKVCHANPSERSRFIRTVYGLLNAPSAAVRYEAAGTLVTLSTAPAAIKAAASCYIDLIVKESDNNVKLIVLSRLGALRQNEAAARALPALAMDVLRVLQSADLDVRAQALQLALDLVTPRHADELVQVLRKEAARATSADSDHAAQYRQLLVRALHKAALQVSAAGSTRSDVTRGGADSDHAAQYRQLLVRALHKAALQFPEVAGSVAPALLELLGDGSEPAAPDVLLFTREALQTFPDLRGQIYQRLLDSIGNIKVGKVARSALWLLAQFADTEARAEAALAAVAACVPTIGGEQEQTEDSAAKQEATAAPRQLVTSDGTYASQSAFNLPSSAASASTSTNNLRSALTSGDSFTAACACSALAKLSLKQATVRDANRALHLAARLLAHYKINAGNGTTLTADDIEHAALCARLSSRRPKALLGAAIDGSGEALKALLKETAADDVAAKEREAASAKRTVDVEEGIVFSQLAGAGAANTHHDIFEVSLSKALDGRSGQGEDKGKLSKVTQLTGFSDPVYAEAIVAVNQYDIVLDVLVVNQTDDTLQNCTVELATLGDLRLVERPASVVLAPRDYATIKAHVKVASTENGIIFGNIVYEVTGASMDRGVVVLNDIHIDIVDYIQPAACSDADFRSMWAEFEWENKVSVNTNITDLKEYLQHLLASTNMKCLTPEKALSGQCGFMAANMYARSIFGEDALANLSIERALNKPDAPVVGHVRIRAKSQGMALSLGDKINMMQKAAHKPSASPPTPAA
ncbi:coatomer subunit beta isoform X2 [Plutella xylostella]|uniref:coatomer subunit beta isoform X1 n=1 Tax=Plutella xylostella TaxID=51655 RepID=UPI0020324E3D|nr:coatomer subunit beta isoform X1 [Plutella xylostella]XP_048480790.1 coatomer subunit beta isoform X2 [Plutella xylostella]